MTLDIKSITLLPGVILEGEEDGLVTNLLADGVKGLLLLGGATAGSTVALAAVGPAALEVKSLLARAHLAENVELALDELASVLRLDVGVEESVDVSTDNIDGGAEGSGDLRALPDIEGLGDRPGAGVAAELGLAGGDELLELARSAETVHDGLVTHNDKLDGVPVSPGSNGVDLLLDIAGAVRAAALNEDTDNELHAVLLASGGDGLEGVAVSGVDAESGEASGLDGNDILLDSAGIHAVTVVRVVRGVGNGVMVAASLTELARDGQTTADLDGLGLGLLGLLAGGLVLLSSLLRGDLRLGGLNLGLLDLDGGGGGGSHSGGSRGRSRLFGGGVRAVHNVLVDGDGHSGGGSGVGARSVDGGASVVNISLLLDDRNGSGDDSADTSLVADVSGHRSLLTVGGSGIRAGDGGRALDNGGDLAVGVGARG